MTHILGKKIMKSTIELNNTFFLTPKTKKKVVIIMYKCVLCSNNVFSPYQYYCLIFYLLFISASNKQSIYSHKPPINNFYFVFLLFPSHFKNQILPPLPILAREQFKTVEVAPCCIHHVCMCPPIQPTKLTTAIYQSPNTNFFVHMYTCPLAEALVGSS